jgi:hypothetical protein
MGDHSLLPPKRPPHLHPFNRRHERGERLLDSFKPLPDFLKFCLLFDLVHTPI